jgi:hypothetical protein
VIKRAPWQQTQFNKNLVKTKKSTKLDKINSNISKHRNKNEKNVQEFEFEWKRTALPLPLCKSHITQKQFDITSCKATL